MTVVSRRDDALDLDALCRRIEALRAAGYHGVVTTAMAPPDEAVFAAAGFRVLERLHLLQHPLGRHRVDSCGIEGDTPTRRARRRDRPGVFAVDRAAFTPIWQLDGTLLADALAATRSVRWRVVRDPDRGVIAYAICGRTGARGYVQRLAVHPDHQGQGLGGSLLLDGLRWMERRGARDALVNTQHGNQQSLRLYQRAGFVLQPGGLAVLRLDFGAGPVRADDRPDLGIVHRR